MTDTVLLQQILTAVKDSRGQVHNLESSVKDLANAVFELSKTSVRYEEKLTHLEEGMKKEIEQQGRDIEEVTSQIKDLTKQIDKLAHTVQAINDQVKFLKGVHDAREESKQWLWRETIGKLIWPAILLAAVGLLWAQKTFGI